MRKRTVLLVVFLLGLVLSLVVAGCGPLAEHRLTRPVAVVGLERLAPGDLERGRRLGTTVLVCTECHGPDLSGKVVIDSPAFAIVVAPNLTSGAGGVGRLSVSQWDLAVRHGLARDGRAMVLMPADGYASLSIEDLADLVAWLSSLPPVDATRGPTRLGPFGALAVLTGGLHVPAWTIAHDRVARTSTVGPRAQGPWLIQVSGCAGCHGEALKGRSMGGSLPAAPALLRDAKHSWSFENFREALRLGRARDGHELNAVMPWRSFANWTDEELRAVWEALPEVQ